MKVQRVGSSANKASLPWPKISLTPLLKTQTTYTTNTTQITLSPMTTLHRTKCLPKKTLSTAWQLPWNPAASGNSFSLLLDLSNNAKCLAIEQGKQQSDSCSFQLTMILTKIISQSQNASGHHWKGSAPLVGFHVTSPQTVLRRSVSRICLSVWRF